MPSVLDAFDAADKASPAASSGGVLAAFDKASSQQAVSPSAVADSIPEPRGWRPGDPAQVRLADGRVKTMRQDPLIETVAHVGTGLLSTIGGGLYGLGKLITTGDPIAASEAIERAQRAGTYEPRTEMGQKFTAAFTSGWNPLNWIPNSAAWTGQKLGDVLNSAGAPAAGAIAAGAGAAAPMLLGFKGVRNAIGDAIKPGDKTETPAARIEPSMVQEPAKPRYKLVNGKPVLLSDIIEGGTTPSKAPRDGLAPIDWDATIQQSPKKTQEAFPEVQTVAESGKLPAAEQSRRTKVLASIGLTEARQSAIDGDALAASTDHQTAKLDNSAGRLMRDKLSEERQALLDATDKAIDQTGGTKGITQEHLRTRGEAIGGAVEAMHEWADTKAAELYRAANEKAQGIPTELDQFRTVLGDDSHVTNTDAAQFRKAAEAKAKQLNIIRDDGSVFSDGLQAEAMRKWLNSQKNPALGDYIRELKSALDKDVLSSAGEDVYAAARKLWAWKKDTLDNPKGISQVGSAKGPGGINRAVAHEDIPTRVTNMKVDQFNHIVKTLKEAPEEVAPAAADAIKEIKAQFANEIQTVGNKTADQWNARGVREYLNKHNAVMQKVFTAEEMANFRNISDAGQILARPGAYPGAAVQAQNLGKAGMLGSVVTHGATSAGALLGSVLGPVGSAAGAAGGRAVGDSVAARAAEASAAKKVQKRFVRLSEIVKSPPD
ncbi:MAG TPA: hypothetical protein VIN03_16735 [Roseateles sp.]